MTHPAFDVEHELRCHGDALRALAGALVRDPNVADDAVQEVWLAALQRPPRHRESLGGWLSTALHNVLRMGRRRERRREQREQIVRSSRGGVDRGDTVAREERARQLLTAVQSLEQPFRDAIWQRFFEGKAPREIAAAGGLPVATVKSRLQRGLVMLRVRLEETDGNWRAGFASAFGFGSEGTAAAAAIATGGIVMATAVKVMGGVLAVAAALAVWMSWPDPNAPVTGALASRETTAVADAASVERGTTPADVAPRTDAAPERAAAPAPAANDAKLATIRGRCVDPLGKPVAGCRALLSGWRCNQERVDAWLRDHPEPDWENPPRQVTSADGLFSFTFWPPPPFQFAIDIDGDGLAAVGARWKAIAEGRVVDVGDVVMVPGVLVQGRVVDEAASPIANVSVHVRLGAGQDVGETPTFDSAHGYTTRDGTFRCQSAVRPGPCLVQVSAPDGLQEAKPLPVTLTRERPVEDVVIVLQRDADGPTITGRVVDERGQPIRDVSLEARDPETGHAASTGTRRDGTFTMKKRVADPGGSVFLHGAHPEFEPARSERTYPWGSTDVVLTMRNAGGLAVHARDEHGTAITDFTVRAIKWDPTRNSSNDADVRSRGPYPSGFAAVPGIHPGSWTLLVEFPTALQRASVAMPIEKTSNDTLRVDITAHADARRTIRVVDAKNEPVAGARVQVCLPVEGPFGDETYVRPLDRLFGPWSSVRMSRALLLMEGATGADGSLVVTGPRRQPLGVCVRGPEHVPLHRGGVLLDDETPLVISIVQGARLFGALRPAAVIPTMQRLWGEERLELRLAGAAANQGQLPMWFERGFPVAADGSFDCSGLAPGEWKVVLHVGSTLELGRVTLRRGESTRFDPDLGYLQTGTLRGTLHKNGAPLQGTKLQICGDAVGPFAYVNTTTDADGRFEVQVGAGAYRAVLYGRDRSGESVTWRSLERATVVVGETTEQPFHVWTGELTVVVRDATGAPVPKLRIYATTSSGSRIWLPPTDAEGTTGAEVNAVPLTFSVLKPPPGLQRTQPDSVVLGTATVMTGQPTIVELRLPAAWDTK